MASIKNTKKIIILAVTVNILVFIVWVFVAYLVFGEKTKMQEIASQVSEINRKKESLQNLTSTMSNTEEPRKLINSYFVDSSTKADLFEKLEQMAKEVGVNFSFNGAQEDATLKFDVSLNGSFSGVYRYLLLVESLPYKIEVEKTNFQFAPLTDKGDSGRWTANLVINVISYKK